MKYKKEVVAKKADGDRLVIIRFDNYGNWFYMFNKLVEVAKNDFPRLSSDDIRIEKLGGDRYSGYFAIEFFVADSEPALADYEEIPQPYLVR